MIARVGKGNGMARKVTSGVSGSADLDTGEFPSVRRAAARKTAAGGMTLSDSGSWRFENTDSYPSYAPITITSAQPLVEGDPADDAEIDPASPEARAADRARREEVAQKHHRDMEARAAESGEAKESKEGKGARSTKPAKESAEERAVRQASRREMHERALRRALMETVGPHRSDKASRSFVASGADVAGRAATGRSAESGAGNHDGHHDGHRDGNRGADRATSARADVRNADRTPDSRTSDDLDRPEPSGGTMLTVLMWIAVIGIIVAMGLWWFVPRSSFGSERSDHMPDWYRRNVLSPDWSSIAVEYIPLLVGVTIVIFLLAILLRRRVLAVVCAVCIVVQLGCGITYFVTSGSTPQGTASLAATASASVTVPVVAPPVAL